MLKPLIAGLTALSLTFAAAGPVHANGLDRDDVGKLIVGIAAIAALNAAIERNNRDDDRRTTDVHHRNNDWGELSRNHGRRVLPHDCIRNVRTRFGTWRLFGQRCLERNYHHVNSLPQRCAVRVYTNNGPRRGFDPLCLREQGYRSDRRH